MDPADLVLLERDRNIIERGGGDLWLEGTFYDEMLRTPAGQRWIADNILPGKVSPEFRFYPVRRH
jgi:hypothetical protein